MFMPWASSAAAASSAAGNPADESLKDCAIRTKMNPDGGGRKIVGMVVCSEIAYNIQNRWQLNAADLFDKASMFMAERIAKKAAVPGFNDISLLSE